MGDLAAIGIVQGKPFEPDERMRGILEDAAAVGSATPGRSSSTRGNPRGWYYDELGVGTATLGRRIQLRHSAAARHHSRESSRRPRPAPGR